MTTHGSTDTLCLCSGPPALPQLPYMSSAPVVAAPEEIELDLAPNGNEVKVRWKIRSSSWSKTLKIDATLLKHRSKSVRSDLDRLNEYVRSNQSLDEARDPGWASYSEIVRNLQESGRGLANALFPPHTAEAVEKAETLRTFPPGTKLKVYCTDGDVSLPLGFIFDGTISPPVGRPSMAHFSQFWLLRFEITMNIEGGRCESVAISPERFKALYALHKTEVGDAATLLRDDLSTKLQRLLMLPVKDHYDWNSATQAWNSIRNDDNVIFVLAHSDGDWLELHNSRMDCLTLVDALAKREKGSTAPSSLPSTLLILNCCLSARGGEGASLLSLAARDGFCGLIGTEAKILNTFALRCGTHLMWDLCANGSSLGEAFDSMQKDPNLFPLNLFYTCYADRRFRLTEPLSSLHT